MIEACMSCLGGEERFPAFGCYCTVVRTKCNLAARMLRVCYKQELLDREVKLSTTAVQDLYLERQIADSSTNNTLLNLESHRLLTRRRASRACRSKNHDF